MAEFAEIVPDERYATASSSTKIDKHAAADLEKVRRLSMTTCFHGINTGDRLL
jgi:hypothetical protein